MRGDDLMVLHSIQRGNRSPKAVSDDTGLPYNTVRWYIWQLMKRDEVVKEGRGEYRAVTVEEM
jgi:hypothetical protein